MPLDEAILSTACVGGATLGRLEGVAVIVVGPADDGAEGNADAVASAPGPSPEPGTAVGLVEHATPARSKNADSAPRLAFTSRPPKSSSQRTS